MKFDTFIKWNLKTSLHIIWYLFTTTIRNEAFGHTLYETLPRSSTDSINSNHDDDTSKVN